MECGRNIMEYEVGSREVMDSFKGFDQELVLKRWGACYTCSCIYALVYIRRQMLSS